jgi:hypothetical protein
LPCLEKMDPDPGVVSPIDAQDDVSISTSSSKSDRQPVLPTHDQGSGEVGTHDVKQEQERMERRNSIVDSDSGRISPPQTKGQWDAFIKRSVRGFSSDWLAECLISSAGLLGCITGHHFTCL